MKNTILIGLSLLVFGGSFASQAPTLNYSDIVSQYTNQQLIADIPAAIKVVEEHYKNLKAQRAVYRPGALRVLGTGLGLIAGVGIIGSVGGALGAISILNSPENSNVGKWLSKQPKEVQEKAREYGVQEYIKYIPFNERGLSYSESLKNIYFGVPYEGRENITDSYVTSIARQPSLGVPILFTGIVAPVVLPISLIMAGLSKYLFSKAASYQDSALEDLIAEDEKMLKDLRAMQ